MIFLITAKMKLKTSLTDVDYAVTDSDFVAITENINKIRNIFIQHSITYAIQIREIENAKIIEGFTDKEYFLEEDEDSVKAIQLDSLK